jgi:prepilin-type N-terminal cleavage/methylation domain-containing protein
MKLASNNKGFTLIELAMVLVIIGLMIGIGASMLGPMTKRAKSFQTEETVKEAYNAIVGYAVSSKRLPANLSVVGTKTIDAYSGNLIYYPAAGITAADLCVTHGTYHTVSDKGVNKTRVAFVVFSSGENLCNETGTASPFTITDLGIAGNCPSDATYSYDDFVMYMDIDTLREELCNTFRIVTDNLPTATEEVAYPSVNLQATDGITSFTWSDSGGLPTGLTLSAAGQISGAPTVDGVYNFLVTVTDQEGKTASKSFSLTVNPNEPTINTHVLHYSSVGSSYNASLAASGGDGLFTWSIVSGSLPPGLALAGNSISGTPATAGTYSFTVQITDGRGRSSTKALSIAINN